MLQEGLWGGGDVLTLIQNQIKSNHFSPGAVTLDLLFCH